MHIHLLECMHNGQLHTRFTYTDSHQSRVMCAYKVLLYNNLMNGIAYIRTETLEHLCTTLIKPIPIQWSALHSEFGKTAKWLVLLTCTYIRMHTRIYTHTYTYMPLLTIWYCPALDKSTTVDPRRSSEPSSGTIRPPSRTMSNTGHRSLKSYHVTVNSKPAHFQCVQ